MRGGLAVGFGVHCDMVEFVRALYVCEHRMHDSTITEKCVEHEVWTAMAEEGAAVHGKPQLGASSVSGTSKRQVCWPERCVVLSQHRKEENGTVQVQYVRPKT
jgi:hypothetical protein